MGYTTYFSGEFELDRQLSTEDKAAFDRLLADINIRQEWIRHEKWGRDEPSTPNPKDLPEFGMLESIGWEMDEDGSCLYYHWERECDSESWLNYLLDHFFIPRGYKLNGFVDWEGDGYEDFGYYNLDDNKLEVWEGFRTYRKYGDKTCYLLRVWGDVEPEVIECENEEARLAKARQIREKTEEDGLFTIKVKDGKPIVESFNYEALS